METAYKAQIIEIIKIIYRFPTDNRDNIKGSLR